MTNIQLFLNTYAKHLKNAYQANPEHFRMSYEDTLAAMSVAVQQGAFLKDTETFKLTCKELGIKHTYKAIAEFTAS